MNYFRAYVTLIRCAQSRNMTGQCYVEKHHIFPRSIFGDNDIVVELTMREHFIAHQLLFRICKQRYGQGHANTRRMAMAIHRMVYGGVSGLFPSSRLYEIARTAVVEAKTGKPRFDMKGKRYFGATEERIREGIEKMRLKKTGKKINYPSDRRSPPCSDEKRSAIVESRLKTKDKFVTMTNAEFEEWLSQQTLFGPSGRKNGNVTRAIMWRGEDVSKYYD